MGTYLVPIVPGVHGAGAHTNVTRELFIPALNDSNANATLASYGLHSSVLLADAVIGTVFFLFKVPDDFVSFVSAKAVWVCNAASGNMCWHLHTNYSASGEATNAHSETPSRAETATGGQYIMNIQEPANPLTLANLAKGDYVAIEFKRYASEVEDTLEDEVHLLGLLFTYVAEQ